MLHGLREPAASTPARTCAGQHGRSLRSQTGSPVITQLPCPVRACFARAGWKLTGSDAMPRAQMCLVAFRAIACARPTSVPSCHPARGNARPRGNGLSACGGNTARARAKHQRRAPQRGNHQTAALRLQGDSMLALAIVLLFTPLHTIPRGAQKRRRIARGARGCAEQCSQNSARWRRGRSHAIFQRPAGLPCALTRELGRMRDNIVSIRPHRQYLQAYR